MIQLKLTVNSDQAGVLAMALSVFLRLCRRDMRVLGELVESGFIPVFDSATTWRSKKATPELIQEFETIVQVISAVIGEAMHDRDNLAAIGYQAASLERKLLTVLQEQAQESVVVVCSLDEAQAAAEALDAFTRLGIGQIMIVEEMLRFGVVQVEDHTDNRGAAQTKTVDRCKGLFERLRGTLNFAAGQSLGVGNQSVKIEAHRAWEMCKVVRQALVIHREPNPAFRGVHYDGLDLLRYTSDPRPAACVAEI